MPYGYNGKVVFVDLSNKTITVEEIPEKTYRSVLGGEGLGALILNERMHATADPLGPDNMIGIVAGFMGGYNSPASPRVMVLTKSPLTGGWGDSNAGGAFGPELKACGYDAIFITGISEEPVYLLINDEKLEIKPADNIWGKDTVETKEILINEYSDKRIKVASIGQSGEKLSLIAAIMFDDRAAARSGVGAVMGYKRLKSIVVRGKKKIQISNQDKVKEINSKFRKYIREVDYFVVDVMRKYGSCGFMSLGIKLGINPIKNWLMGGEECFPNHAKLDGENVVKYRTKRFGCLTCPIACGGSVKVDKGRYKLEGVRLPEYETLNAFGPFILCDNVEAVFRAQELCDRYGIDTISAGHVVAMAIECYENGIISKEDTGGIELGWGEIDGAIDLLEKIVKREGFGDILADGVKLAAERIGKGSEKYGIHMGGQEPAFHDFRYEAPSRGATYISDPTPSRHERCSGGQILQLKKPLGPYEEFKPRDFDPDDFISLGKLYAQGSRYYSAFSACGFCAYILGAVEAFPIIDLLCAATGWDNFTPQDFLDAGERIQSLRQIFNIKAGIKPSEIDFHPRLKEKPLFEGPMRGSNKEVDYYEIRKGYYEGSNWDKDTGKPLKERMEELELGHVYD